MLGIAVKQSQTGEEVISQSHPLGQHRPHLNTRGEESIPSGQVSAEQVCEGENVLFLRK